MREIAWIIRHMLARRSFITIVACITGSASALQASSSPTTLGDGPAAPAGSAAQAENASDADPLQAFRMPLLREGSMLIEAPAHMRRDVAQNWWVLVLDQPESSSPTPVHSNLIVLPCTRLSEMERIIEATPGGQVRFRVSGRIYVYRDQNYILPSHAAIISAPQAPHVSGVQATATAQDAAASATTDKAISPTTAPPAQSAPAGSPPSASRPQADDSAEAIAHALEQETGPIARSSGAIHLLPSQPAAQTPAESASEPAVQIQSDGVLAAQDRPASGPARAASQTAMQENTAIVNRRGKIVRDRSGGWVLVLDADASALADPPLRLLPCMLLENIEDYARRSGNNSPIIITGQVGLYNGQNFLLPTVYRIPHERSRLTP